MTSIYTLVYPLNGADDNESSINSLNISIPLSDVSFLTVATSLGRSFQETYDDEDLTVTTPSELLVTFVEFIVKFLNSSSAQELSQESREIHVRFLYDVLKTLYAQGPITTTLRIYTKECIGQYNAIAKAESLLANLCIAPPMGHIPKSALVSGSSKSSSIDNLSSNHGNFIPFLHFSGQGNAYLPELQQDYDAFPLVVEPIITAVTKVLEKSITQAVYENPAVQKYYKDGVSLLTWLTNPLSVPKEDYLRSAPLSFPLIGLTQLCHYAVSLYLSGISGDGTVGAVPSPQTFLNACSGATGHSQGVVAAVAAARATTAQELVNVTVDAITLLFWQGLRMQETFDTLPTVQKLPPPKANPNKNSTSVPEDEPSPMLAISGLTEQQVKDQITLLTKSITKIENGAETLRQAALGNTAPIGTPASLQLTPLTVSLVNGNTNIVVSGRSSHLQGLYHAIDALRAPVGVDQARIPHSQRKPTVRLSYIKVTAPYHCSLLSMAAEKAIVDCARVGLSIPRNSLRIPVYSTADGRDLRSNPIGTVDDSLVDELIRLQCTLPVNWPASLRTLHDRSLPSARKTTHILDFGPGGASSAAKLTARHLHGCGIPIILANLASITVSIRDNGVAELNTSNPSAFVGASVNATNADSLPLFDIRLLVTRSMDDLVVAAKEYAPNWATAHGPRLVRRAVDNTVLLDTAYSRLLGRPPIMIAGMTPCTSYYGIPLVAAGTNAGYHTELACGGLPRPNIFRERISKLQSSLNPGHGIGLNMLYLNARQWSFQYPMVGQLIAEGVPIETVCIAAGVPTLDTGIEIVKTLASVGVRFVSFKPGSVDAIRRTCEISAAVAPFPIVLQWTGGRAGGHHSFEDVFAPVISTYAFIRRHSNIVLLAGSGMGSWSCALPWITGTWAIEKGWSIAPMPFDGILVASRVMVAKEATTSYEIKQVLVDTPGIEYESEWETSYNGIAGGILTVKSELGEPIHKVANRGMLFWRELDTRFFALPRDKRAGAIAEAKAWIIEKLNADYQKVYFGQARDGTVIDPDKMTYAEVAMRMVQLMFVQPEKERLDVEPPHEEYTPYGRWIDVTFRDRVFAFLQRTESTFHGISTGGKNKSLNRIITSATQLNPGAKSNATGSFASLVFDNPMDLVKEFFTTYSLGNTLVLSAGDYDSWLEDCRNRGKPVPFVPIIDGELEVWFKKDSLWYSEDLAAVPDRDANRVAILQGPVAVRHSKIVNEPVADILNGINNGLCTALEKLQVPITTVPAPIPTVEALGGVLDTIRSSSVRNSVKVVTGKAEFSALTAATTTPLTSLRFLPVVSSSVTESMDTGIARLDEITARLTNRQDVSLPSGASLRDITWILALFSSSFIVHNLGTKNNRTVWKRTANPVRRIFSLRANRELVLTIGTSTLNSTNNINATNQPTYAASLQLVEVSSTGVRLPLATAMEINGTVSIVIHDVRPATPDAPQQACPLTMNLQYNPATSYAPFSLNVEDWCNEVKRYYASLWFNEQDQASIATLDVGTPLVASYQVTSEDVRAFTESTSTPLQTIENTTVTTTSSSSPTLVAPSSLAILAGWRALIKCLFPRTINGDILTLVHLTNSFTLVDPPNPATIADANHAANIARIHTPLSVGETVSSNLIVSEVSNTTAGKIVTVEGLLSRSHSNQSNDGTLPWVKVRSQFLFRGNFRDHHLSFKCTPSEGIQYTVTLSTAAAVSILQSKAWFNLSNGNTLSVGDILEFTVHYREEFASANTLRKVTVTGSVIKKNILSITDAVATVHYEFISSGKIAPIKGNPVIAYLSRASASSSSEVSADGVVPLDNGGFTLLQTPDVITAPKDNIPYAIASRDLNPIHRNEVIADLAGLPATIVHGMWTSANGQRVLHAAIDAQVKNVSPSFEVGRMIRYYSSSFVGMVMPGDTVVTQITHTGMHMGTGRRVMSIVSSVVRANDTVETVLQAIAHVDPPPTAYVFTGQGSASMGMGMELYEASAVARKVWDIADNHLRKTYGFSILEIVRRNPKSLTIHFGGRKGSVIRRNYMSLETDDGSGSRPLLPQITEDTDSHTFVHPDGLLFATQFTQPALVLVEKAAFDDIASKGLVPKNALFAGHSLGEYAALASAVPLLPVPTLVSLTFLRGMVMQGAVPRDEAGTSEFGMVACNPTRVGPFLTEEALHALVNGIASASKCLLEVVNYNVSDRQYVVAGHLRALDILGHALTFARAEPKAAMEDPAGLVKRAFAMTDKRMNDAVAAGKKLILERGEATIPLPGVDVPFHSRFLLGGVPGFRSVLHRQLTLSSFRAPGMIERMLGCYVPNLIALPFSLGRYFAEEVVRRTQSPELARMLASDEAWKNALADPPAYARSLVIELLAYQFASPVQWIATQHYFFSSTLLAPTDNLAAANSWPETAKNSPALPNASLQLSGFNDKNSLRGIHRLVEIGPAMTLVGMGARTLETGKYGNMQDAKRRQLLWFGKDSDEIYYRLDNLGPTANDYATSDVVPKLKAAKTPKEVPVVTPVVTPVPIVAKKPKKVTVVTPPPAPVPSPAPTPTVTVSAPAPAPPSASSSSSLPTAADEPPTALEALQVMLATKLNQPLAVMKPDTTIKSLVGGKSAVQNEILGELEKEFGSGPEGGAEMPLADVAKAIARGYKPLGKITSGLVAKMLSGKLPGGFGAADAKTYLANERGLGNGRIDGVLLHGLSCQPEGRLGSETDAKAWLEKITDSYGSFKGINLSKASAGGASLGGSAMGFSPELLAALLGGGGGSTDGSSGGSAGPVPDAPVQPIEFIRALLGIKLNQPLSAIKADATIKTLVGGKSAVQNEILGELEKEFGSGPEGGAEMPLTELAKAAGGKYKGLGKVGSGIVAKLVAGKFPGGFGANDIRTHLSGSRGIGPLRADSVLLYGAVHQPEGRLGSEAEAKAWLDKTADAYAKEYNVQLSTGGGGSSGGSGGGASAALLAGLFAGKGGGDSAALTSYQKRMAALIADQITAYQNFIAQDPHSPHRTIENLQTMNASLEENLALWRSEHGEAYENGIKPSFDAHKQRTYESAWAWGLQQLHQLLYSKILPNVYKTNTNVSLTSSEIMILANRFTNESIQLATAFDHLVARTVMNQATSVWSIPNVRTIPRPVPYSSLALLPMVSLNKRINVPFTPIYVASFGPTAPSVRISPQGKVIYEEIPRPGVPSSRAYVVEMARAAALPDGYLVKVLKEVIDMYPQALEAGTMDTQPKTIDTTGTQTPLSLADSRTNSTISFADNDLVPGSPRSWEPASAIPYIHLRTIDPADSGSRIVDRSATAELYRAMLSLTTDITETVNMASVNTLIGAGGSTNPLLSFINKNSSSSIPSPVSFIGKVALITGCGVGSIGIELVKALVTGGATVIATTSRFSHSSTTFFRKVYEDYGGIGSRLFVLPFNQGSLADVNGLVNHVYNTLKLDLDYIIPFGAIPENGHEIDSLDNSSELAHRLMMTNVLRLLGAVAIAKRKQNIDSHPALALLPLSPNHGVFGNDGLYAESKLGLEAVNHKWHSENWNDCISIAGAVIGWTRGTGLMAGNNIVSPGVEKLGCRTFSQTEMALNLMALLHPRLVRLAAKGPIWADFRGGFHAVPDLKAVSGSIRAELESTAAIARAVSSDASLDDAVTAGPSKAVTSSVPAMTSHTRLFDFPSLPSEERRSTLSLRGALQGMIDLDRTVVVTGYGEVCPWGNARTRWEMETEGEFSMEGSILLAWITGRIKYFSGPHPTDTTTPNAKYSGWVDSSTNEPVADTDIKNRYEKEMLLHAGIRVIESELFDGYDPHKKLFLHQVALDRDMTWIEVSSYEDAEEYRRQAGNERVDIAKGEDGVWRIRLRKGAVISVPKALRFDRWVAGQLPTGWEPTRFGIPPDMIGRMDPVVLYSLVSVAEALLAAGVTDPYEFFSYVHVSDVGNSCGGGMGGMTAFKRIFRTRYTEGDMPSDTLQESFINTVPAWINMLLLSSSGPIKTPVGACATAAESIDIGVDTILSGKASVMIVGGVDDFCEEGSYEFAQMGATSNTQEEIALGREPTEMCRPMAPSRGGFMEAQGAGLQILMTAKLAIAMGVPIYGVVALSNTATDKNGRSIPAPGQGILTTAREDPVIPGTASTTFASSLASPLLDVNYRRKRLTAELASIHTWRETETTEIAANAAIAAEEAASSVRASAASSLSKEQVDAAAESAGRLAAEQVTSARLAHIAREATLLEASARRRWCAEFWSRDPSIAPLRGALAVYGMTVDDITVGSFHGTGTHANDLNESRVTHAQMAHLGRTIGQPLYVVAQKGLTGHPKGAAAAWMANGGLQMLQYGTVPGNRNGEDIDEELRPFTHLAYISRTIRLGTGGVKAVLLKSFGFGQAGGEVLLVHPDYLLSSLDTNVFNDYSQRRTMRERIAHRNGQDILANKRPLLLVKNAPPYTPAQETKVYLYPSARVRKNPVTGEYAFHDDDLRPVGPDGGKGVSAFAAVTENIQGSDVATVSSSSSSAKVSNEQIALHATLNSLAVSSVSSSSLGVGVDVEPIRTFTTTTETFVSRNFTVQEQTYCKQAADPSASYAGRWAAKEAIVKALTAVANSKQIPIELRSSGAGLNDIEIIPSQVPITNTTLYTSGAPSVTLTGHALVIANKLGINPSAIRITISHSGEYAVAVAAIN